MTFYPPILLAETSNDLLGALGIDWRALILNVVAFLIILWLLSKYIYPVLTKALDTKADELDSAAKLQQQAKQELEKAERERHSILGAAQVSADQLVEAAQAEANETIAAARDRATKEADRIVAEAREQLAKDVTAARRTLRAETAMLVAQATEAVVGEKLDSKADEALINRSLENKS